MTSPPPDVLTAAGTTVPPGPVRRTVAAERVSGSMPAPLGTLTEARTNASRNTPPAPLAGVTLVTVGDADAGAIDGATGVTTAVDGAVGHGAPDSICRDSIASTT